MNEKQLVDIEGVPAEPLDQKLEHIPRWQESLRPRRNWRHLFLTLQWGLLNIFSTVALVFMNKM